MITLTLIIVICIIIHNSNKKKALNNIQEALITLAGSENVTYVKSKAYDFMVNYNEKTYLIKMIYHPARHEINVNAKDYWQVNKGVVSSRKTGEQMQGVYELINFDLKSNNFSKNTVKLYVIYPSSRCLMKVLNECEMQFIKPKTDIYGTKMTNFTDLVDNFNEF